MTKSIPSLRAGVIGTGFIGPAHIEALQRNGVRITTVCDDQRAVDDDGAAVGSLQ